MGIDLSLIEKVASFSSNTKYPKSEPIPLNKVGQYNDGKDGNTTLLVELNGCKHITILDSGASIAIATKKTWEQWGKTSLDTNKNETTTSLWSYTKTHRTTRKSFGHQMWD